VKLTTTVTAKTTTELKLSTKLQNRLRDELAEYAALNAAYKQAEAERDAKIADIEELREQIGETSVSFEGATITRVGGTTKTLDKKKFVELGGSLAMLENATTESPKKAHTKVTLPKEPK
jgi:flagellar motility protein MotE (MotC chaperone)